MTSFNQTWRITRCFIWNTRSLDSSYTRIASWWQMISTWSLLRTFTRPLPFKMWCKDSLIQKIFLGMAGMIQMVIRIKYLASHRPSACHSSVNIISKGNSWWYLIILVMISWMSVVQIIYIYDYYRPEQCREEE